MLEFTGRSHPSDCEVEEDRNGALSTERTSGPTLVHWTLAHEILRDVMQFRRTAGPHGGCDSLTCAKCLEPHLSKIAWAVAEHRPVQFVLPAFPGKSPNLNKVLGVLPDMAERRALEFLQHLCDRVKRLYAPGAHIVLCSDGRVFSDVVGLRDEDVTVYQKELARIIAGSAYTSLTTFDLDDVYDGMDFDQMRARLMEQFGEPLDDFRAAVRRGGKGAEASVDDMEAHRLYCGITRFLLEDATYSGQTQSRTAIQKDCRARAYAVIQRSKAWGDWVETQFPQAVRLSIHPQTCGAKKLGIRLVEPDNWTTPWHAVAVDIGGRFMLLKRSHAEALGAELQYAEDGRPSHYILKNETTLTKALGAGREF